MIGFYRRIFAIFYWQCFLPASIDSIVSKLSRALNRHILLYSLINFLSYIWCLHIHYCQTYRNTSNRSEIFNMFIALYAFPIWIATSFTLTSFENFKKIWFDLFCLNNLLLKRLNHKTNYKTFQRSVVFKIIICLITLFSCGILKSNAENELLPFHRSTYALKLVRIYIELHAMFVISLHQYMYGMFCKYINFAYHLHRSNLVFLHANDIGLNLRHYKEIHYKLWAISCELNRIFGIIILTFCCQTSIEFIVSICHMFSNWDAYYTQDFLKLSSIRT